MLQCKQDTPLVKAKVTDQQPANPTRTHASEHAPTHSRIILSNLVNRPSIIHGPLLAAACRLL